MCLLLFCGCSAEPLKIEKEVNTGSGRYSGKTVILHSNDVHGYIEGYAYMAGLKSSVEAEGGTVIVVDAGDFSNGTVYVGNSKGESAVTLMEQTGYDIVVPGNHDFDFGPDNLKKNVSGRSFVTLLANVTEKGNKLFDGEAIVKIGDLSIGFFGILSPETQTKVMPTYVAGMEFPEGEALYKSAQNSISRIFDSSDVVICLSHLGVSDSSVGSRSTDLWKNVLGLDFIIDGHSHTVMTESEEGFPIQSTGTGFEYIGMIVIDNKSKKSESHDLIPVSDITPDDTVLAAARNIIMTVDEEFGATFARTEVDLDGTKSVVRSEETNLGDLVTDAMLWSVLNETKLRVDDSHVVAILNGGGIRASVPAGDISRSDIKTVLPFGNTIAVIYVTGADILEALEASTFSTPEAIGGFPQVSGIRYSVDTSVPYDAGEEYPGSTYFGPASVKRVSILEINGKPFDETAEYAVVSTNFAAEGGDTYYAFKKAQDSGNSFDTSVVLDEAVVNYIQYELAGVIGEQYALPAGRIGIR